LAVITTLDQEHLDHYGTYGALVDGFVDFANKVPFYGAVLLGIDDPQVRSILPRIHKPMRTYGTTPDADLVDMSTGESVNLRSFFTGKKPVLLWFWAGW